MGLRLEGDGTAVIELRSGWAEGDPNDSLDVVIAQLKETDSPGSLLFKDHGLDRQDALVAAILLELVREALKIGFRPDLATLPEAIQKLVQLALAVPPKEPDMDLREDIFTRVGRQTVKVLMDSRRYFEFSGELVYSFRQLVRGKARFRKQDFWVILQECGANALPIVALISILVGVILGFVGAVQLRKFGATIYMIDLVALSIARELGCIMAGIIMSGRTGAAFAAQLGSMNVNQEVDALETLGISPMEFLVLPRALAMILMMPILTLYADVLGFFGGFLVAIPMGITPSEFWIELMSTLDMTTMAIGLIKSFFFGIIIASSGCYYGLLSGRSSAAVGEAATKAVVAGITWIIVLDALFSFMLEAMGI